MSQHNLPVLGSAGQSLIESNSEDTPSTVVERDGNGDSKIKILRATKGLRSDGFLQGGAAVKSANFSADDTAHVYIVDAAADVTVSLPSAATVPGRSYVFIKRDNGVGKIVLDAFGAELVNGAAAFNGTATQYKRIDLTNDGVNWFAKEA